MQYGKLFICATPIGNLGDITLRVLDTLKSVDLIAAEDTRHTLNLLRHFDIKKPLTSYYEHNKTVKGNFLIEKLKEGNNIALVSDAGTPIISDPGDSLVKLCLDEGIEIESLPGACAAITALTLCGLDTKKFVFEGFLSIKKTSRTEALTSLKNEMRTMIFYEAPHKLKNTLKDLYKTFGDRKISVCRELTKKYEEVLHLTLSQAIAHYNETDPIGEFVLVVEGSDVGGIIEENPLNLMTIKEHVQYYIDKGQDKKDAIKMCAADRDIPKRDVYNEWVKKG